MWSRRTVQPCRVVDVHAAADEVLVPPARSTAGDVETSSSSLSSRAVVLMVGCARSRDARGQRNSQRCVCVCCVRCILIGCTMDVNESSDWAGDTAEALRERAMEQAVCCVCCACVLDPSLCCPVLQRLQAARKKKTASIKARANPTHAHRARSHPCPSQVVATDAPKRPGTATSHCTRQLFSL